MTAQTLSCVANDETISHISNKSPQGKSLFSDAEDYATFLSFLEEYLIPPSTDKKIKEFTVKGKVYKGVPHQPKNYSDTISLLAYSLSPNQFDLIIKYSDKDNLQRFMRSLSTRYSIYFHKKYPGTGSVFKDSYVSKDIKDDTNLLNLSHELHQNSQMSSFQDYLEVRQTEWVNTGILLGLYKNINKGEYKDFVSPVKTEPVEKVQEEKQIPEQIPAEMNKQEQEYIMITTGPGFREVFVAGSIFLVLLTFGFKNVYTNSYAEGVSKSQYTTVLSEQTEVSPIPSAVPEATPSSERKFAIITTSDESQLDVSAEPSTGSAVIASTTNGRVYEIISQTEDKGWYQIKLNEKLNGYVPSEYIEIYQNE